MKTTTYPEIRWMKEVIQIAQIDDQICEFEWTLAPGGGVPEHLHLESDEYFTILEGEVTFRIDGKMIVAKLGDEVLVPKKTWHGIQNKSTSNIRCKVSYTPVADQGKFLHICAFLSKQNPNDKNLLFKAMYIQDRLDHKAFSTLHGWMKFAEGLMKGFFKVLAPVMGWNKLARQYVQQELNTPSPKTPGAARLFRS
ncbi:MAG: cupin domain-containing protein [Saprospiraceae bacterium]